MPSAVTMRIFSAIISGELIGTGYSKSFEKNCLQRTWNHYARNVTTRRSEIIKESDLIPPLIEFLNSEGWFCVADADKTDYFDVACIKGDPYDYEVMLVELKLNQPKTVYHQAYKRRWYADFVTVGMPKLKSLQTVHRYDQDKIFGLIEINENVRWYNRPRKNDIVSKNNRKRIAGVLFAIKEGIIKKSPSAMFMMYSTSTIMGKPIERYTRGWPENIRELLVPSDQLEKVRIKQKESEKQLSLEIFG